MDESLNLSLYHIELNGDIFLFDERYAIPQNVKDYSLFVGSNARRAVAISRTRYIPIFLSEMPWLVRNHIKPDVTLINTTRPDGKGFVSLGQTVEATKVAVENSRYVIAQLNDDIPGTFGDSTLPFSLITHYVNYNQEPIVSNREKTDQIDRKIGENVAELIPDGATIQAGIAKIPDAAMSALNERHLGIHTELFSDGMMELVESGAVDNSLKKIDKYHLIATFSKGKKKLYDFLDDNPMILMRSVEYTNDTSIIRKNRLAH
jgi:4-hydroxybutyrate CoA-transferase